MASLKSTLLSALVCFLVALEVQQVLGAKTLLYNGMIVTMDPSSRVYKSGAVLIDGKIIAQIGQSAQLFNQHRGDKDVTLVNLNGKFVLPGFINTHVHTNLQIARGIANDLILSDWLGSRLFPFEAAMTEDDAYVSALATGIELIRSGVTTFAEAGGQHMPGVARAVEELGLRAALTQSVLNFDRAILTGGQRLPTKLVRTTDDIISSQVEMYHKYNGAADGRLRVWFGIRQITTSTDDLLNRTRDKAKELHTGIHMHVAVLNTENAWVVESRGVDHGTVTFLEKIKLLDSNLLASVVVWVNDEEIGYLAKAGVKVSHCPANSMYTFGFSPIQQMLDAGITISLATDGPSNNRMSIIDEMYAASLSTKGRAAFYTGVTDPKAVPAEAVLKMVTIDGAKSLLWEKEIGSIETRKKADLIIVDPFMWTMEPILDSIAALVYSMRSENIESVMCDGKWLMRDRKLVTVDEAKVLQMTRKTAIDTLRRANVTIPQRMSFV